MVSSVLQFYFPSSAGLKLGMLCSTLPVLGYRSVAVTSASCDFERSCHVAEAVWKLLCRPGWTQMHRDLSGSGSQMLGLKVYTTTSSLLPLLWSGNRCLNIRTLHDSDVEDNFLLTREINNFKYNVSSFTY